MVSRRVENIMQAVGSAGVIAAATFFFVGTMINRHIARNRAKGLCACGEYFATPSARLETE